MKTLATLICTCMALAAGGAAAQDTMKKGDSMAKDRMTKSTMTMQQCKDHMAMQAKEGAKKDDATMKKDAMCADMMKKEGAMTKDAPKKY